jgi:mannose-1-phosphate guanylyltransferase
MKAIVLVGGEGTRLRPLTFTTPKPLLPIANQPHLDRQLAWLAEHGADEVVLSMGYLPDAFQAHFAPAGPADALGPDTFGPDTFGPDTFGPDTLGPDRFGDVTVRYAVEDEPLGTAGAIKFAAEGIDERFLVCNGDVLTDLDLGKMVGFHDERGAEATISLTQVEDPSAFGVVPTRADGEVIAFVEKPPAGKAPSKWINAGTYVLEPRFLDRVPPRLNVSIEREVFPRMLSEPGHLFGFGAEGYWLDIGTPEKYLQAHIDALEGRLGPSPAPDAREHARGIWIQGDVHIDRDARLRAPVLLGSGARVEAGAEVEASVVGPGVVLEGAVQLRRSAVHAQARLLRAAEVCDSVVGEHAVVEPDAVLRAQTLIGARAVVPAGTRLTGGRLPEF